MALSAWRIDCSKYRLHRIHEEVLSSARGIPCNVKKVKLCWKSTINSFRSCCPRLRKIHGFVRTMICARNPTTTASESSMPFFPALWFLSIGTRTVPRMYCCFMENWSRCFTRKSDLERALNMEMALNRSRIWQLGVASMKRLALSWTRPSSMKPRTESTAKTGARLCELGRGRDV